MVGLMGIMGSTRSEVSHLFSPNLPIEAVGLASKMQDTLENKHTKFASKEIEVASTHPKFQA
jgi:hypothetical protein